MLVYTWYYLKVLLHKDHLILLLLVPQTFYRALCACHKKVFLSAFCKNQTILGSGHDVSSFCEATYFACDWGVGSKPATTHLPTKYLTAKIKYLETTLVNILVVTLYDTLINIFFMYRNLFFKVRWFSFFLFLMKFISHEISFISETAKCNSQENACISWNKKWLKISSLFSHLIPSTTI